MASSIVFPCPQWISRKRDTAGTRPLLLRKNCFRFGLPALKASSSISFSSSQELVSPCLMLPPSLDGTDLVYNFYRLDEDKVVSFNKRTGYESSKTELPDDKAVFVGSSHGWIFCHNMCEEEEAGNLFLSNPITCCHIKLPSPDNSGLGDLPIHVRNVVISSSTPDDENCRALMTYGPGHNLAFCCPNRRSSSWTPIGNKDGGYCSSVYSTRQKLFFCLNDDDDGIEAWDLNYLHSPMMIPMNALDSFGLRHPVAWSSKLRTEREANFYFQISKSLVVADKSDDLYLVRRFTAFQTVPRSVKKMHFLHLGLDNVLPYKTTEFDVYKYDKEAKDWKYMDGCLDGMALFIGINHGFALSAHDYPDLKPDAVYFTDIETDYDGIFARNIGGGHDIGIFNYRNKTLSPCYYPCDYQSIKMVSPPPFWFTPKDDCWLNLN